jgi:hypothetical protein
MEIMQIGLIVFSFIFVTVVVMGLAIMVWFCSPTDNYKKPKKK